MRAKVPTPIPPGGFSQRPTAAATTAFTLVELLVVMVIITILASLSLAGMAGARQRAKIEKTKSTIRKIDSVIQPMYDSYRNRRAYTLNDDGTVPTTPLATAGNRLKNLRRLMTYEMPDNWADVASSGTAVPPGMPAGASPKLLSLCRNGTTRAYGGVKEACTARKSSYPTSMYGSAECLYMILTRSGFDSDALEAFRSDEITDIDSDGAKEFVDGWGRPIAFLRWAPGFSSPYSPIQFADPTTSHDPLDPLRLDSTAFAMRPLIYSPGPDEATNDPLSVTGPSGYGLLQIDGTKGWNATSPTMLGICQTMDAGNAGFIGSPDSSTPPAYIDNITNHDLLKK